MPPTSFFTKELGGGVGNSSEICIVRGTQGVAYGVQLSAVESSGSRDRVYRMNVKAADNPVGWRRLVSLDKTESGTTWAVDVSVDGRVSRFRLVRTQASAVSSVIKCKVVAQSAAGGTVGVENSDVSTQEAVDEGVYEGALLTQVDGKVGIGTDTPQETLDVRGSARISGNLTLQNLLRGPTGNALYVDTSTGKLSYGEIVASGGGGNVFASAEELTEVAVLDPANSVLDVVAADAYAYRWILRKSAGDNGWWGVAYGGGTFVAVGEAGNVMTSSDGITWTLRNTTSDSHWLSVAYGSEKFVAVAWSGTGTRVMTSSDGVTWTLRTSAADYDWTSVTYGGDTFVAVASSGEGNRVMTSADAITWTLRNTPADLSWTSVTYGDGKFVAVASSGEGSRVMTSSDGGVTWTLSTSAADYDWTSVTYGEGKFVAVASSGQGNRVMTSLDGSTWTLRNTPADSLWTSVTYGGGTFVAVAAAGDSGLVMTSGDGISWTLRNTPADSPEWRGVAFGNGVFVAVAIFGGLENVMTWDTTDVLPSPNVSGVLYYSSDSGLVSYGPLVVDVATSNIGSLSVAGSASIGTNLSVGNVSANTITTSSLNVNGNVLFPSLSPQITGNAVYVDVSTGKLSFGEVTANGVDQANVYTKTQLDGGQLDGRYYTETEVNEFLGNKENLIATSTTSTYYRGDKTFQELNTTAVPEGSNLYFTNARAQAALVSQLETKENLIQTSTTSTYFRGDKTFQALTTTAVTEGSNLYFTDARAQAAVVSQSITDGITTTAPSENAVFWAISSKANVANAVFTGNTTTDHLSANTLSVSGNIDFLGVLDIDKTYETLNTSVVIEDTNLYFTNLRAQTAAVSQSITDGVTTTAPSENAVFNALSQKENVITASTTATYFRGDKTFQTLDTNAVPEGSNLYFTDARAQAALASQLETKANATNATISGTLSVSGNIFGGNLSTNAILATAISGTTLSTTGNARTGNAITVGTSEIWNLQDQNERWRLIVSEDATGNFFQLESFVDSQWTGYLRIDK